MKGKHTFARQASKRREHKGHTPSKSEAELTDEEEDSTRASPRPVGPGKDGTVETQAARLNDPGWLSAQRRRLAEHMGRTQGNQHVMRVIDQVRRKDKPVSRADLKTELRTILGLEWMKQSNGKGPIQLTKAVVDVIQMVTPLSTADLKLLWRKPPRTPGEVLSNIDHSLPATVAPDLMAKLQSIRLNLVVSGAARSAASAEGSKGSAPSATQPPTAISGIKEKEALLKAIIDAMQGKGAEDKSVGTEAVKKSMEGFLGTDTGKKVKERALEFLLSKKGLPFTLLVGSAGLAAMVANNTDIPSTPEIPLSDNLSIKVEFEGTFKEPKGVKFSLKFSFGGPAKEKPGEKKPARLALPPELHAYIGKIDKNTLISWIVQRAFYEWEMAGPDEEEAKKRFYQAVRDRPEAMGLPDAQSMAEELARALVERSIENRVNQLKGKEVIKQLNFDLGHTEVWDRFLALTGLAPRLDWLLNLLVPKVPYNALGIEQVTFLCGKRLIPVKVKR